MKTKEMHVTVIFGIMCMSMLDGMFSYNGVSMGMMHEVGPFMSLLIDNWPLFMTAKIVLTFLCCYLLYRLSALKTLITCFTLYSLLCSYHIYHILILYN